LHFKNKTERIEEKFSINSLVSGNSILQYGSRDFVLLSAGIKLMFFPVAVFWMKDVDNTLVFLAVAKKSRTFFQFLMFG